MARRKGNSKPNSDGTKKRFSISDIIAFFALLISILSIAFNIYNQIIRDRVASYFEPLNYYIEYDDSNYIPQIMIKSDHEEEVIEIENPSFLVVPETGGIRAVSVIYYFDNKCYAINRLHLTEKLNHKAYSASNLADDIYEFTQYAFVKGTSSKKFIDEGFEESYFSTIYVCVEDFNKNCYITPIVFEYPIVPGKDKVLHSKYDHREYTEIDLLYRGNGIGQLPIYDGKMLEDYSTLLKTIKEYMQ